MKLIYCIEEWIRERENTRDGGLIGCVEVPWKVGCFSFVNEYTSEDMFKKELYNIINRGGIIGKVFIKEVADEEFEKIKHQHTLRLGGIECVKSNDHHLVIDGVQFDELPAKE